MHSGKGTNSLGSAHRVGQSAAPFGFTLDFEGALLARGFWLYVWRVTHRARTIVYVGRTGDSSSCNAGSPIARLGLHLDVRKSASANMLLRHMKLRDMDPVASSYRMVALGPIFPEQTTWAAHERIRDIVAPMEAALARHMTALGFDVVGMTSSRHPLDEQLFERVLRQGRAQLDALLDRQPRL